MHELLECRICKCIDLTEVVNLGNQIITSRFPMLGDKSTPAGLIRLVMCNTCKLVQLKDSTPASEMYEHFYGYRSGINAMMRDHLYNFNHELQTKIQLNKGDLVLDIGSNDCTFLSNYPEYIHKYGCDPTATQFKEFYTNTNTTMISTYFTKSAIHTNIGENTRFKAITSISMFYDLPDPVQFAKDIYSVLHDDGIWGLEQSYVATMLERNSIDTICHEHLEYYGVKQIKEIMDRAGFKIIDITLNECNGGSFRTFVAKKSSVVHTENIKIIQEFLKKEEKESIHTIQRYKSFISDCEKEVDYLVNFIKLTNADNKQTYIYGASTKGNCLLQYAKLDSSYIPFAVERNPHKVGRTTSTGIEIISEETMRKNQPAFMLVLPWHFRDEIIQREKEFLDKGGQFIFPFPHFEVYSNKPKTLITGINGQIGTYVENLFIKSHNIYGITKTRTKETPSTRFYCNLKNTTLLENIIKMIQPSNIIHLAGISNTELCEINPTESLDINARSIIFICELIHKMKLNCKIFNASSSELFKGNINYTIKDNDSNFFPDTIYANCKLVGHTIVNMYRNKYNLPFSNGILFTTESKLRDRSFLFKKVAEHAKTYLNNPTPIHLGNLDSWRNINHAEDVASAINTILEKPDGNTYVICNSIFIKVEDLVCDIYKKNNIILEKKDNTFIDTLTNNTVIILEGNYRKNITKINGESTLLNSLGWTPKHTYHTILDDISNIS